MAGLCSSRLCVAFLLCVVLITLTEAAKDLRPRKHKKYDPSADVAADENGKMVAPADKKNRSPRQAVINERRQYYPCISCFKIGTREICTSPFCPENHQCDRNSKRCHKKANVRGRPAAEEEGAEQPAET